jgi:hypothetical protein
LDYEPKQDLIERERAVGYRDGHRAALAQRTWVGLTYEDMIEVWNKLYKERTDVLPLPTTFAKAIEAKLKEKNT